MTPNKFHLQIEKPEWLDDNLRHAESVFRLTRKGKIPESIKGWMLQNACLRVLRAIHGSDLATAVAIREHCIDVEMEAMATQSLAAIKSKSRKEK